MHEEALWHLAETTDVFVELDPQQKERIVRALQHRGHAVAYLGDGINDAPALHAADVGVSVDQAVDVARETADIVLLQRDLGVLRDGIVDGRRTFVNTLKYVAITTSANFGNMISMAVATLFVPFLPLLAKQILLNNFLSDIPSVAISTDNVDPGAVDRAAALGHQGNPAFMLVFGLISTAFDLSTFALLLGYFQAGEATVPDHLVRGVAVDGTGGRPGAANASAVLAEPAQPVCWSFPRSRSPPWRSACRISARPRGCSASCRCRYRCSPAGLAIVALYILATEIGKRWFYGRAAACPGQASCDDLATATLSGLGGPSLTRPWRRPSARSCQFCRSR